jgi:hypothetical protein
VGYHGVELGADGGTVRGEFFLVRDIPDDDGAQGTPGVNLPADSPNDHARLSSGNAPLRMWSTITDAAVSGS